MLNNIENSILNTNNFETALYKNLSILQAILHEVEHANQNKIAYSENSLESLIIRLSYLVENGYKKELYEYCSEERLAEIKSFEEINTLMSCLNNKNILTLFEIINTEKLKRMLRGYHYRNASISVPIIDYFTLGNKKYLLNAFEFSSSRQDGETLNENLKYGFPISIEEYSNSMKNLVLSLNKNFSNRINIKQNYDILNK